MKRILWALLVLVSGCGGGTDDRTAGEEIADDYNEALDKAAAVEDQLEDAKSAIDAAIEDGEDSDDD